MDAILWVLAIAMAGGGLYIALNGELVMGTLLILLAVLVGPGGSTLVGPTPSGGAQESVQNPYSEFQGVDGYAFINPVEQR